MAGGVLDKGLIYVTGKGGVGKTTVAASLGVTAAAQGRRTIVVEVAEQDRVSRAFLHHEAPREVELQLDDRLWAISIDPRSALEEWLGGQLRSHALVRTLTRSHAFQYFVAAAPGAKELITVGKIWELAQLERWDRHNRTYDLVIVDAPASGHGVAMLRTPQTFGEIARVGPIRRQAEKIRAMLADAERTAYVAVSLAEETPVTETLELDGRIRDAVGFGVGAVVVNGLYPERFAVEEAERLRVAADGNGGATALDGNGGAAAVDRNGGAAALDAALAEHRRARAQRTHLRRLRRGTHAPVVTLPFLFEPELGLAHYRDLGALLARRLP